MTNLHFADVWEAVAEAIPDAAAIVQGERRVRWGEYEDRAARLASVLLDLGAQPGTRVGLYLHNGPEYLEANFAALKVRAQPINVNYRYLDDELVYLLDDADAEILVYGAGFAERVAAVRDRLPKLRGLIGVADGGETGTVADALAYENVLGAADRCPPTARPPEDTYMLYTGGTTGMPKGVIYRVGDMTASFLASTCALFGFDVALTPGHGPSLARRLHDEGRSLSTLVAPPLMHGTGIWIGAMAPQLLGSSVHLTASRSFDAAETVDVLSRHHVGTAVIVGDAFARPLLDHLEALPSGDGPLLPDLRFVASSGAMLSARSKERLLEIAPDLTILDLLGASEGSMGVSVTRRDLPPSTASFRLNPGVRVIRDDGTDVEPGSGEIGMVATTSLMVPVGYHKDPIKSAKTFREIDGTRYAIPGDMAVVEADGTVSLLGRGSNCINTGGEKVFPEEVEEAIKVHPSVEDCLIFGEEDERFGQRVVGVVALREASPVEDIIDDAKRRLSSYKLPRELRVLPVVPRAPNGKADYATARAAFVG